MPPKQRKRAAAKPAERPGEGRNQPKRGRAVQAEPETEVVDILADGSTEENGKAKKVANGNMANNNGATVDFESFLKDAGLLDAGVGATGTNLGSGVTATGPYANFGGIPIVEPLRSAADEVFIHVPMSLREQIWRGEYINLALLLKGALELNDICAPRSLCLNASGQLETKAKECKDKVNSIESWTDAFLIYMSIYVSKFKDKACEMLRYMALVREATWLKSGYGWRAYDEGFRQRQAFGPTPWNVMNQELWSRIPQRDDNSQTYQSVRSSVIASGCPAVTASQPAPSKCYDFNKGECTWPNCHFAHLCESCGGSHARVHCPSSVVRRQTEGNHY